MVVSNENLTKDRRIVVSRIWLVLVLLAYAFLYDNSSSVPIAAGYSWTHLLPIPRQIRLVEIAVVLGLVIWLIFPRVSALSFKLLLAIGVFGMLAMLAFLIHPIAPVLDVLRLGYAYVLPILIFIIGREAPLDKRARQMVWRFLLAWVTINAVLSWFQFAVLGYPVGDNITGLNKDAHANGNLLFFASLLLISRGWFLHRRILLVPALIFAATAVLSSVLKSTAFTVAALCLIAWQYLVYTRMSRQMVRRIFILILALVLLAAIGLYSFVNLDRLSAGRMSAVIDKITSDPGSFGPVISHVEAFNLILKSPVNIGFGLGAFSYANPISYGQTLEQGSLSGFARDYLVLSGSSLHGEDALVTLTSSILAEFGLPAILVLTLGYLWIGQSVWHARRGGDAEQLAYSVGLMGCWLILMLTALTSIFGSLDVISVSWPVMLLMGMTSRLATPARKPALARGKSAR